MAQFYVGQKNLLEPLSGIKMSRKRRSDTSPLEAGESAKKNNVSNDAQSNRISSKTLRTTANTFFGTGVPTSRNESPTNQTDQHDGMSRNQMVQLLDPLISAFNAADFDSFAKTLRRMCAKDVEVVCKLIPPMPTLESSPDPPIFQQQHCLKGISALLLLWILLHESHPDAVLQIIGKRICYRQLMESYELPIKLSSTESDCEDQPSVSSSIKSNCSLSSPTNSDNSSSRSGRSGSYSTLPISILESIWKFSGSCVTTQTMDVLFTRLSQDPGLLAAISAATAGTAAPKGSEASAQSAAPASKPPATGSITGTTGGQNSNSNGHSKLNPAALSEYISNFLTHERLRIPSAGNSRARTTKRPSGATGTAAGADDTTESAPEQNRRYLIETRLVFNEKDQVSHWTFNLLAAESV